MIRTIKNSLAYRLPQIYRYWLGFKQIKNIPYKPPAQQVIMTMTGKKIIDMTRLSILSIAKSWNALPTLIVCSDGTISAKTIAEKLSFWPGELVVKDWQETENYHLNKKRPALIRYAHQHVLGRKLAVIFHHSELQPVIWLDSDILFFNSMDLPVFDQKNAYFGGSEEGFSVYDDRVLTFFNHDLYNVYKFSSGILAAFGCDVYEEFGIEKLLSGLVGYDHYFTEQTIFAHLASKSLGIVWPMEVIKNYAGDNQELTPINGKAIIARHYTVNVRHLFWRDAFFHF